MAIGTITGGERLRQVGTFQSVESLTQSTSTTPQALSITTDVSVLGMGTATGSSARNLYTLAAGVEGQHKMIYCNATGEAGVIFTQKTGRLNAIISGMVIPSATTVDGMWASATGQYVFNAANDWLELKYMNDAWWPLRGVGATLSTTT